MAITLLKVSRPFCFCLENSYPMSSEILLLPFHYFSPSSIPATRMLELSLWPNATYVIVYIFHPFFLYCFILDFLLTSIAIKSIYWFLNFSCFLFWFRISIWNLNIDLLSTVKFSIFLSFFWYISIIVSLTSIIPDVSWQIFQGENTTLNVRVTSVIFHFLKK